MHYNEKLGPKPLYSKTIVVKNNNDSLIILSRGQRNWCPRTEFNQMIDELKINEICYNLISSELEFISSNSHHSWSWNF